MPRKYPRIVTPRPTTPADRGVADELAEVHLADARHSVTNVRTIGTKRARISARAPYRSKAVGHLDVLRVENLAHEPGSRLEQRWADQSPKVVAADVAQHGSDGQDHATHRQHPTRIEVPPKVIVPNATNMPTVNSRESPGRIENNPHSRRRQ